MRAHKSQGELKNSIEAAKVKVKIGGQYVHFKSADMCYRIVDLAIDVNDGGISVVYRALYGEGVLFTRSLKEWLEVVEVDGRRVSRFTLVD
jgi:hypothetical protein